MNWRETVRRIPPMAIAAVVMAAVGVLLIRANLPDRNATYFTDVWFYDLDARSLYARPAGTPTPEIAPSGGQGVRAYVFSCGKCSSSEQFIGYLQSFTREQQQLLERRDAADDAALSPEPMVALLPAESGGGGPQWVYSGSRQGAAITRDPNNQCGNKPPRSCNP